MIKVCYNNLNSSITNNNVHCYRTSSDFFPILKDLRLWEWKWWKIWQLTKEEQEFIEVNVILVTTTTIEYHAVMGATEPIGGDGK